MTKEFVPYQESLSLKELGFDEPCFATHGYLDLYVGSNDGHIKAPTFSQAFRWFREKHGMHYSIQTKDGIWFFDKWSLSGFKTHEEAELACLRKLIEIVKGGEQ